MTPHSYFMAQFAFSQPIYWGRKRNAFEMFLEDSPTGKKIFDDLRPVWVFQEYKKGYRVGAISPN